MQTSLAPKPEGLSLLIKQQILKALKPNQPTTLKQLNRIIFRSGWVTHKNLHLIRPLLRELEHEGKVRHEVSKHRNQYWWYLT